MRLAVSSIAWTPAQEAAVAEVLQAGGADAVELAPTALWPDPLLAPPEEVRAVRARWEARGLPVVALQSLVFGRPDLQLFDPATRDALRDRLAGICALARELGATRLVFGSPKNRLRGPLPAAEAFARAVAFFREVGRAAEAAGVVLCVEPNPPQYGCDFVTTAAEGRALVEAVASPGFGLHLDAAGMLLAGDDAAAEVARAAPVLRHVHLSAPQLGPVGGGDPANGAPLVGALARAGYQGVLSIEMRAAEDPAQNPERVRRALALATRLREEAAA